MIGYLKGSDIAQRFTKLDLTQLVTGSINIKIKECEVLKSWCQQNIFESEGHRNLNYDRKKNRSGYQIVIKRFIKLKEISSNLFYVNLKLQ